MAERLTRAWRDWRGFLLFIAVMLVFSTLSSRKSDHSWSSAVLGGAAAESFLGTQGDVWDTQWDMFLALVGAATSQLLLARRHDRELSALVRQHGLAADANPTGAATP